MYFTWLIFTDILTLHSVFTHEQEIGTQKACKPHQREVNRICKLIRSMYSNICLIRVSVVERVK